MRTVLSTIISTAVLSVIAQAQAPIRLSISPAITVSPVSPTLYGLMTEEINYSYDGGLYAEQVRNRTFTRNWQGFEHWSLEQDGSGRALMSEEKDGPSATLKHSLKLTVTAASPGNEAGIVNEGFWGIVSRPSSTYNGSFYAKTAGLTSAHVRLVADSTGATLAEARVPISGGEGWKRYSYRMTTGSYVPQSGANHLVLAFEQPVVVSLQMVSLFPPTFNDRPNGNRPDLMALMKAMRPNFLRMPGGNYLEGDTLKERFDWKQSLGPLIDRPTHRGPWNYQSTDGIGLLEFLYWTEELKVEPVLAVFAGYSLKGEHVVGDALKPYVEDALDEIEFVTGDTSTHWGAVRAQYGHPAPFPLHYIEIGNEDQFDNSKSYDQRFSQFAEAIRAKYPQYKLIATTPVKSGNPDVVDDHYYQTPEEFFSMVHKYDKVDRTKGPKIFVGEWATRVGSPTPNMAAALGDAAWMTGMERNSDLIVMASYAPLFVNVNPGGMQWSTDLIGYDVAKAYGSPAYWAQVIFASHLGDHTVQSSAEGDDGLFFHSATVSHDGKTLYLKLVNASDRPRDLRLSVAGIRAGKIPTQVLSASSRWATNTLADPNHIHPVNGTTAVKSGEFVHSMQPNSIEALDIPLQ